MLRPGPSSEAGERLGQTLPKARGIVTLPTGPGETDCYREMRHWGHSDPLLHQTAAPRRGECQSAQV